MSTPNSGKAIADGTRPKAKPFVQAIYEMAMLNNPVVGFSADGTHLEIRDVPRLCEEVLPRYFKHRSLSSLFRQLNLYGFEKVAFDGAAHAFRHDFFRRDRADLLDQVSRSNSSRKLSKDRRPSTNASAGRDTATSSDGGVSEGEGISSGAAKAEGKRTEIRRVPPPEALQFKLKPFVYATFEMVSSNEGPILGFSHDGRAIEIRDVTSFAAKILPRYFKHNQFSSFARQMNMYGFEKIDSRSDISTGGLPVPHTFFHESFRRGRLDLLPLIVRKTKGKRALEDDEQQYEDAPKRVAQEVSGERLARATSGSGSASSVGAFGANSSRRVMRFIESLYEMSVQSKHSEIGMDAEGAILEIRDVAGFMKDVLPLHFNHKDFAAFIRQLSVYGFVPLDKSRYRHPYFIAGREDLLDKIVPVLAGPTDATPGTSQGATSFLPLRGSNPALDALTSLSRAQNGLQGSSLFSNLPMLSLAQAAAFQTQNTTDLARFAGMASGLATAPTQSLVSALNGSALLSRLSAGPGPISNGVPAPVAGWIPGQTGELPLRKVSNQSPEAEELTLPKVTAQVYGDLPLRKASGLSQSGSLPLRKTSTQSNDDQSLRKAWKQSQESELPLRKSSGGLPQRKASSQSDRSATQEDDEDMETSGGDEDEMRSSNDEGSDSTSDDDEEEEEEDGGDGVSAPEQNEPMRANKSTPFVQAAYEIAMLDNAAVGFNAAGTALEIRDETLFATEVLPKFFKHGNISSFIRQLNMYSFEKTIGSINSAHTFQHKFFRKDSHDLLALISRKQSKPGGSARGHSAGEINSRGRPAQKRGRKARFQSEVKILPAEQFGGRTKPTPFVHAVYELAMLDNDAIGWSKNGRALEIRNEALLAERHLPKYFKHRQVSSLIRQLNMYGFEKTDSAMGVSHTFQHEFFERNHEDLLPRISRKHKGEKRAMMIGTSGALDEDEDSEPSVPPPVSQTGVRETRDAIAGLTMLRNLAQSMDVSNNGVGPDLASILGQTSALGHAAATNMFQTGIFRTGLGAGSTGSTTPQASMPFPSLTSFPILGGPFTFPGPGTATASTSALHSILQQHQNLVGSSTSSSLFNAADLFSGRSGLASNTLASLLFPQNASVGTTSNENFLAGTAVRSLESEAGAEPAKVGVMPSDNPGPGLRPLPLLPSSSSENGCSSEGTSSSGDEAPAAADQTVAVSS